jgi:hypothetical protein
MGGTLLSNKGKENKEHITTSYFLHLSFHLKHLVNKDFSDGLFPPDILDRIKLALCF